MYIVQDSIIYLHFTTKHCYNTNASKLRFLIIRGFGFFLGGGGCFEILSYDDNLYS